MSSTQNSTAPIPFDSGLQPAQQSFLSMLAPVPEQRTQAETYDAPSMEVVENETEEIEDVEPDAETAQLAETDDDPEVDEELSDIDETQDEIQPEEPTFTVRVNGEDIDVPLSELQRGYSRQSDYTAKTQALAEQRRETAQELENSRAKREQYDAVLAGLEEQLKSSSTEPDWAALLQADPSTYAVEWAAHQQRKEQQQAVEEERKKIQSEKHQELVEQQQNYLADEAERLLDAIPEWRDQSVAQEEKLALINYGKSIGFTDEELGSVTDHRSVLALRNAMRFDQLQSKAKTVKPVDAKPTLRPGSSKTVPKRRSGLQKAQSRLRKTGSVAAATDVFSEMLSAER